MLLKPLILVKLIFNILLFSYTVACDGDAICVRYHEVEEQMLNIPTIRDVNAVRVFCKSYSRSSRDDCVRYVTGTNRTDQTDNKTVIYGSGTNYFNYVRNTNDKTLIDGLNDSLINEANFAPWEWMINYDANRYGIWFIALIIRSLIQFRLISQNLKSNRKQFNKTCKVGFEI